VKKQFFPQVIATYTKAIFHKMQQLLQAQTDNKVLFYAYTRVCLFFAVTSLATGMPATHLPRFIIGYECDGAKITSLLISSTGPCFCDIDENER